MKTSYDDTNPHRRNIGGKMPFKSKKQRTYLRIHEPALAKKWEKKYGKDIVAGVRGKKRQRRKQ